VSSLLNYLTLLYEDIVCLHIGFTFLAFHGRCRPKSTRKLFEKIYPGFFIKLKTSVNEITLSELRMAALVKLHLTTRQIAAILGISPNSVNKTKQRLRQRLHVDIEKNIEEVIADI